ncbi:flavodoxin [Blautia producta]|uniref:flavodoxin n=1 Tax=Blautia producta TaxID=33035 RepID=UPI0031B5C0A7
MKKWITLFMSLMLVFGLAACGNNQQTQNTEPADSESKNETASEESATEPDATETEASESAGGKTLVVYYSATGSTENVANTIASATSGDLFELEPVEPYSSDDLNWTNDDSRVAKEHENEDQRDVELVSATVDNWSDYDTVFIGYPIWWGIAAWPVDEFIESNDFTGKTVIPFCTSASSGLGDSGELLEEMAGTGEWQEGQRFRSGASEDDVRDWVEELGL